MLKHNVIRFWILSLNVQRHVSICSLKSIKLAMRKKLIDNVNFDENTFNNNYFNRAIKYSNRDFENYLKGIKKQFEDKKNKKSKTT